MLSKSQAKLFFIAATVGFSGVFLWLSVDTVMQIPARTNQDALTPAVARGKHIWDVNNCMGCHTLFGEGAYYAPELTQVVERRGEVYIRAFLRDPEAMYPGRRRMINYHFTEDEISDVIAFFVWVGNVDTNGFPADPPLAGSRPGAPVASDVITPASFAVCSACHMVGGQGGTVGPALDGVASRFTREELDAWLEDPQSVRPGTAMPNPESLGIDDAQLEELSTWLMTLE